LRAGPFFFFASRVFWAVLGLCFAIPAGLGFFPPEPPAIFIVAFFNAPTFLTRSFGIAPPSPPHFFDRIDDFLILFTALARFTFGSSLSIIRFYSPGLLTGSWAFPPPVLLGRRILPVMTFSFGVFLTYMDFQFSFFLLDSGAGEGSLWWSSGPPVLPLILANCLVWVHSSLLPRLTTAALPDPGTPFQLRSALAGNSGTCLLETTQVPLTMVSNGSSSKLFDCSRFRDSSMNTLDPTVQWKVTKTSPLLRCLSVRTHFFSGACCSFFRVCG